MGGMDFCGSDSNLFADTNISSRFQMGEGQHEAGILS